LFGGYFVLCRVVENPHAGCGGILKLTCPESPEKGAEKTEADYETYADQEEESIHGFADYGRYSKTGPENEKWK
jgi:hypothetical protein